MRSKCEKYILNILLSNSKNQEQSRVEQQRAKQSREAKQGRAGKQSPMPKVVMQVEDPDFIIEFLKVRDDVDCIEIFPLMIKKLFEIIPFSVVEIRV